MTHYWPLIAPEKNEGMIHMIFHWFSNSPFELVARCLSIIKIPLFGSQDKELPGVGWVEICWNCEQVTVHVCSLNADLNGLISWKHTFLKNENIQKHIKWHMDFSIDDPPNMIFFGKWLRNSPCIGSFSSLFQGVTWQLHPRTSPSVASQWGKQGALRDVEKCRRVHVWFVWSLM